MRKVNPPTQNTYIHTYKYSITKIEENVYGTRLFTNKAYEMRNANVQKNLLFTGRIYLVVVHGIKVQTLLETTVFTLILHY